MGPHVMRRPPKFVQGFIDRHGKPRWYLRRPGFKRMPSHFPSAGQSPSGVALVSGPRTVRVIRPLSLVTTSSQRLSAIERNGSVPSL